MKKILSLLLLFISLTSCEKNSNIELGSFTLGERKEDIIKRLERYDEQYENEKGAIRVYGEQYILGRIWDGAYCKFKDNNLNSVVVSAPFESLSRSEIEDIKSQLRELCGYEFNSTKPGDLSVGYGTDIENNGCIGGIAITDYDDFVVIIRLPNNEL